MFNILLMQLNLQTWILSKCSQYVGLGLGLTNLHSFGWQISLSSVHNVCFVTHMSPDSQFQHTWRYYFTAVYKRLRLGC